MTRNLSAFGLPTVFVALFLPSCGARTGLVSPEPDASIDAGPMPVGCMPGAFDLTRAQPAVMFVLDRSGSMGTPFVGSRTRWQVLTGGLTLALPSVDDTMQIGALLFPSTSGNVSCNVMGTANIAPGLKHVTPLLTLMQATRPGGSTPTADAIDVGAKALLAARAASGARAIVLATDGGPNCNPKLDARTCTCSDNRGCGNRATSCLDDVRTVERIATTAKVGLPTYVIGIQNPGETQNNAVLDAMADAGGRPKAGMHHFYAATSEPELDVALVAIRDQLGSCTYLTTSVPDASGTITVTIDGRLVAFDAGATTGWHWANQSNGEIVFAGDTCAQLAGSANPKIVAHVTCSPPDADADSDAHADAD